MNKEVRVWLRRRATDAELNFITIGAILFVIMVLAAILRELF